MTTMTRLPASMRQELAAMAANRLMQSLDAVSHAPSGPPTDPPDPRRLLELDLPAIPTPLSRDVYWVLTHDPDARHNPVWDDVGRRAEALQQELRRKDLPEATDERQHRLVNLTFFTAAVMVPLLAERGAYRCVVRLAEALRKLVMSESHRLVLGAGAEGADPRMRFLLLSPIFWSLAAFHPAGRIERSDDR